MSYLEMSLGLQIQIKDVMGFTSHNKKQVFINIHDLCSSTSSLQVCQHTCQ